jgi:hypothetical protein
MSEISKIASVVAANSYQLQAMQLVAWIKGRVSDYPANSRDAAVTMEATLALYEAARTGQRVQFPLRNRGSVLDQYWPDFAST